MFGTIFGNELMRLSLLDWALCPEEIREMALALWFQGIEQKYKEIIKK